MNAQDRAELRTMLEDILKPIVQRQDEHHSTLFGDGSEHRQGLRVDVDRLKQIEGGRSRHFWAVYTVLIGLILKDLWTWVRSLGGAPHVNP
jgi:hypothetical protein